MNLRLGAKLPHSGPLVARLGLVRMAAKLEAAGFDSLWVSDHVVFPHTVRSRYPFAPNGRVTWPVDIDYIEPVVALSAITSVTSRAEIGTSVLILPTRNPVLFAKQAACIDVLSGGRLVLGVGAGWLREEFSALRSDFESRGAVLDEWLDIARRCWTGSAGPYEGRFYRLEEPIYCRPVPVRAPPVLIGGMSRRALERAGRSADGWLAQFSMEDLSEEVVGEGVDALRAASAGKGKGNFRVAVRVTGAQRRLDELGRRLGPLAAAGATEVIVDVDWDRDDGPARAFETLRAAVA
ncbi:MAG: TIGR03619 family F420-dependent LLM class oxidoreductase [Chloroflexi bacterium]|nr:MAG: TIGR03619 family F420-dependent LLM class oxidoreductase [Chloroflexota bacterium]